MPVKTSMDSQPQSQPASIHYNGRHYDRIYEQLWLHSGTQNIEFLANLAAQTGDSILELCCGTGRVAIPLAERGFQVTGVDIAPSMLEEGRQRSQQVEWIEADIQTLDLHRQFSLIIFPTNSIWHLTSLEAVEQCFACVRRHLQPNGRFLVEATNLANQDILMQLFSTKRSLYSTYEDPDGQGTIVVTYSNDFDFAQQINRAKLFFQLPGKEEEVIEDVTFRHYFPQEIEMLLKYNGFKIEQCFGDYDQSPFTSASPNQLLVCRLTTETSH